MQQTPPPASSSHSSPAAPHRQLRRRRKRNERERVGKRGSFITSHHPLSLLWKKHKKVSTSSFFSSSTSFFPLSPPSHPSAKTGKFSAPTDFSAARCNSAGARRGAERRDTSFHTEEWDAIFFLLSGRERLLSGLWGSSLYSSPSLPPVLCLSTAHVTSPWFHGNGSTCCRQEDEDERKRRWEGDRGKRGWMRRKEEKR